MGIHDEDSRSLVNSFVYFMLKNHITVYENKNKLLFFFASDILIFLWHPTNRHYSFIDITSSKEFEVWLSVAKEVPGPNLIDHWSKTTNAQHKHIFKGLHWPRAECSYLNHISVRCDANLRPVGVFIRLEKKKRWLLSTWYIFVIIVTVASLHKTNVKTMLVFFFSFFRFLAEIHLGDNGVQRFYFTNRTQESRNCICSSK